MKLLLQFHNVLVYVLLGAGFVKLMLGLWLDASVILGVVVLNGLLGFVQEGRAEKALDSIRNMLSAEARTVRGGETQMIPAEELVPGDVVLLESGDRIPADLRLVDVKNLRTEEAALTGESVPADKSSDAVAANATVGDRDCMAYSGTLVVSGRATGVVVGTGSHTELGRINQMLAAVSPLETPLLRQIKKFGYAITAVVGVVSVLVFAYGRFVQQLPFVELFQAVVEHRRLDHSGRAARADHHHARDRRPAHGAAQRHHPAPAGRRDARLGVAHLLGQDGHAHPDGDDGGLGRHGRVGLHRDGRRLRGRGRGPEGWEAGRRGCGPDSAGARLRALQRRRAAPGGRGLEGRGRSDRGRALSVRLQARAGAAGGTRRAPPRRRHSVRVGAPLHGDPALRLGRGADALRRRALPR